TNWRTPLGAASRLVTGSPNLPHFSRIRKRPKGKRNLKDARPAVVFELAPLCGLASSPPGRGQGCALQVFGVWSLVFSLVSPRIFPGDVTLQLVDRDALRQHDPLYQVADGNDSNHLLALQYGQMTNTLFGHDAHTALHGLMRGHEDDRLRHDFAHFSFPRGPPFQDDLAGVIALGN